MKNFKSAPILAVAIDATQTDQDLLQAASDLQDFHHYEEIHFVHVMPRLMHVANQKDEVKMVSHSITEEVRVLLRSRIEDVFRNKQVPVQLKIRHGIPYRELIQEIEQLSCDTLIIGVKKRSTSAITPARIAHGVACNVLFVPEGKAIHPQRIMVPVDLSIASGKAIKMALRLAKSANDGSKVTAVTCVHIVQNLPVHFYYGFEINLDHINNRNEEAKVAFAEMLEAIGVDSDSITEVRVQDKHGNVANQLLEYSRQNTFDLVILNATGHSLLANLMVGSVAEKFVHYCRDIPILLTR